MYQYHMNSARAAEHQQDMMQQGANERSLRAMRREQREQKRLEREAARSVSYRPGKLKQAWKAVYSLIISL